MGIGDQRVYRRSNFEITTGWLAFAMTLSIVVWQVARDGSPWEMLLATIVFLARSLWATWTPYAVTDSVGIVLKPAPALRKAVAWQSVTRVYPMNERNLILFPAAPPSVQVNLGLVNVDERVLLANEVKSRALEHGATLG